MTTAKLAASPDPSARRRDLGDCSSKPPANFIIADDPKHFAMQLLELASKRSPRL
jgi:hypothetical protein